MSDREESIYREGYGAFLENISEGSNPYLKEDATFWVDGWEDAKKDLIG